MTHLRELQNSDKIAHIGLTKTDTAHLKMLLDTGFTIATNQVSCSVLDRRVIRGPLNDLCLKNNAGLVCYGTLLGGFLSKNWLGQTEPTDIGQLNRSPRKYLRFIKAVGGWKMYQGVLQVLASISNKRGVSIPAIVTRYVLDVPSVKAVIIGTRLRAISKSFPSVWMKRTMP
jgi:aryl-alcohol dehydrogenase-like predicted oxidoreductase